MDIGRIRRNWSQAILSRDIVGTIFYQRLFAIAPETRGLFPETLDEQGRKLVMTLSWIVDHLEDTAILIPAAQELARRHVDYGATAHHYVAVGEALIQTLHAGLGDDFSKADEEAWREAYSVLSSVMIEAAYPAETAEG